MTDQERLVKAIRDAGRILSEHLEPGHPSDPEITLNLLFMVLDNQELAAALERLEQGFGLRIVK